MISGNANLVKIFAKWFKSGWFNVIENRFNFRMLKCWLYDLRLKLDSDLQLRTHWFYPIGKPHVGSDGQAQFCTFVMFGATWLRGVLL